MRVLAASTAGLLAISVVAAQEPAQQPLPRFRTGVDVVLLDVTVLDKARRPVRGLTASDFTILEEGSPQPIVSFEELDAPEPDGSLVPWMREVAPDVRTNTDDHRRLVLIVLNDAAIPFQFTRDVKEIGRKVVDHLGPSDHAAIVFTGRNSRSQDFTSDRRVLREAIDRSVDASMPPELAAKYGLRTTQRAVQALLDIPHRRKALIYVGGTLVPPLSGNTSAPIGSSSRGYGAEGDAAYDIQQIIKHAQRANVTVYTASPAGLQAPGPGTQLSDLSLDALNNQVNETGGFAISNTNNFDAQIRQIFRETGSYYLLGFQSAHADGKFRRIEVKVNRRDVTVRTRNGYTAARPEKEPRRARGDDTPLPLAKAVAGILPTPDMPMRVVVAPFAGPGKDTATAAIVLGLQHPAPRDGTRIVEKVDVMSRAFDADGRPRGWFRQVAQLTLRPAEGVTDAKYEVFSKLELRPGRYQLRFAVHSGSLGKSGSVYHHVEVPDFTKRPLTLSGVLISVDPPLPGAPKDFLTSLAPVAPTTQRSFSPENRVTAFFRVYQGGRKPPGEVLITTTIVNEEDREVFSASDTAAPEEFGTARAVERRIEVPVGGLAPGAYLLRIGAAAADRPSQAHEVRFVVRER
ncbi:MAG TPA: VWA domain-containing protein [Vicinamibacterales bacterium]|nr:VWA domain-containing protein [Vicinamibacterales bacterium]